MPHKRFLISARLRQRLYARRGAYWYWALTRNAHDNYEELGRIREHMRGSDALQPLARWLVDRRLSWLQRTATPEPPPVHEIDAILRESGSIHDTTAYEYPVTTIRFFPGLDRRRRGRDE